MKKELIKRAQNGQSAEECLSLLREELHHLILQELDRKGAFSHISFMGGTAARILYGLDRYSEDLDFSLSNAFKGTFNLESLVNTVLKSLNAFDFDCDLSKVTPPPPRHKWRGGGGVKTIKTVQSCFFNFREILHQTHRAFPQNQKLAIKLEVDTNPPRGAHELVSPVSAFRLYKIGHHDLPSLFAGKLCAVLCRQYSKGRDLYDFLWHTARKTPVNLNLLKNGLEQMEKKKVEVDLNRLREMLAQKFEKVDFDNAKKTTAPFLINKDSLALFEKNVFLGALNNIAGS